MDEVIEKFQCEGDFAEFLTEYKKNHSWAGKLDFLKKEDNEFLREYFFFLGRSDYLAQKEYFSSVTSKLENLKEKSAQDATRYTDLYIKLGFLLGLIIVILLV